MKILLINIDSVIPNIALVKIEYYYQQKGAEIIWNSDVWLPVADKIYVSCIFTKNRHKCKEYEAWGAEIGGTGYDIKKKLPIEIEKIKPRINLDFATRGCIRKCKFCFVSKKEGKMKVDRDLYDIWDGKSKEVILLDNNILAEPEHFKLICKQAIKENIKLDFNQGLDIRLVTDEIAKLLSKLKMKYYRFALDQPALINVFRKKLEILNKYISLKKVIVYVLVGFDTEWDDDMKRLLFLKSKNCRSYLMRHANLNGNKKYIVLSSWVNQRQFFMTHTFEDFVKIYRKRGKPIINESQLRLFYCL